MYNYRYWTLAVQVFLSSLDYIHNFSIQILGTICVNWIGTCTEKYIQKFGTYEQNFICTGS